MTTIDVDLNNVNGYGRLAAFISAADGPLMVGGAVTVYDALEDQSLPAKVVVLDPANGLTLLDVDWRCLP